MTGRYFAFNSVAIAEILSKQLIKEKNEWRYYVHYLDCEPLHTYIVQLVSSDKYSIATVHVANII